jgi:hypothetical protein
MKAVQRGWPLLNGTWLRCDGNERSRLGERRGWLIDGHNENKKIEDDVLLRRTALGVAVKVR